MFNNGKIKLTVELVFYNDLFSLKRCIPSFINEVDNVLAIDGRHTTYKRYDLLSDDGSREYLQSFNKIKLIDCPDYEVVKRKLAKTLSPTDFLLIIDSDEYVVGDWDEFYKSFYVTILKDTQQTDLYCLPLERFNAIEVYDWHPVLFHIPAQFTYYQNKHNIPIKKRQAEQTGIFAPTICPYNVKGIKLRHDHRLRSPERMLVREDNLSWQQENNK